MRLNRLISNKIFAPFKQGPFRSEDSRPCDRKKSQGRGTEIFGRSGTAVV